MAVRSFQTASISTGSKRSKFWDQSAVINNNSYESISTVTVGSGGSSEITFSSIPQTYKHLQLRCIIRNTSTSVKAFDNNRLQINGQSTNYSRHGMWGLGGGTVTSFGSTSNTYIYAYNNSPRSTVIADVFAPAIIDILDYTDTNKNKTVRFFYGSNANTDVTDDVICIDSAANFNNTNAVTSITFTSALGNYAQYSQIALYGVKV